jgi:hypothetical protein
LYNRELFNKFFIITRSDDKLTQFICKKYDVECIISDRFGAIFNKGKALNDGLKHGNSWCLSLDSDIIIPTNIAHKIKSMRLNSDYLYSIDRIYAGDNISHNKIKSFMTTGLYYRTSPVHIGFVGYFQLFNIKSRVFSKKKAIYPEQYKSSNHYDVEFYKYWSEVNRKPISGSVLHLPHGRYKENWKGMKSKRFILQEEIKFN